MYFRTSKKSGKSLLRCRTIRKSSKQNKKTLSSTKGKYAKYFLDGSMEIYLLAISSYSRNFHEKNTLRSKKGFGHSLTLCLFVNLRYHTRSAEDVKKC